MPNYRIEALVHSPGKGLEDQIEQGLLSYLYDNDFDSVQLVAFEVFPHTN